MAENRVRSAKLAVMALLLAIVVAVGVIGIFVVRSAAVTSANHETCEAVKRNNDILRDLIAHVEQRSIAAIKTGATKDITTRQVHQFYGPTLRRIDAVQC